jgi:hypothetical protein
MQDHPTEQELKDRLSLIENMIAEGRRTTESWAWAFVLWGVVYYLAILWSAWGHNGWAWPVTVSIGVIITVVVASRRSGSQAKTTLGRAIGSIWIALGISMFVLLPALGLTGRLADQHLFVAAISTLLGMANGASALILRWKIQFFSAFVWWAAAVASCFGSDAQSTMAFLIAIFVCQIVFGVYGMIAETHKRGRRGSVDARFA